MEEVKRYTIDFSDGETAEGVLYDDYAALKARCEELGKNNVALKSRAEELQKTCLIYRQSVGDLEKERDSLRSQLEAANERHFQAVYELGVEIEKNEKKAQLTAQPDGVRLREAVSKCREVINRAKAGDPEMDWDQAFQEIEDELGDAVQALAALEQEWRSIETAPKDGTPVLAYDLPNELHLVVYWTSSLGGFWQGLTDEYKPEEPTHWLPLPTPPKEA